MFARSSSFSSDIGSDEESLMPPGASTPMFSPIAFLRHPDADSSMDVEGGEGRVDDGLMSPLSIGGGGGGQNGSHTPGYDEQAQNSSPPQPEDREGSVSPEGQRERSKSLEVDEVAVAQTNSATAAAAASASAAASETKDPANQAYLGRVDELDTGPLHSDDGELREGDGETGTMAPHGMSDHPIALSRTTTIEQEERKIAGLPRSSSVTPKEE